MSGITTKSVPRPADSLGSFEVDIPGDRTAAVKITGSPANCARVDIRVVDGRHWVFAVTDDVAVLVLVLNENGQRVDDDLPRWIEPVIQRTGLEGVEA